MRDRKIKRYTKSKNISLFPSVLVCSAISWYSFVHFKFKATQEGQALMRWFHFIYFTRAANNFPNVFSLFFIRILC